MSDFPEMEYKLGDDADAMELMPGATSLDFLQKIYRSSTQPIARRMRAAMAALPFESPKLAAVAVMNGEDFSSRLDRAIVRSGTGPKLIEAKRID
jgi:hypothetical protein